jgi:hypothetical protein
MSQASQVSLQRSAVAFNAALTALEKSGAWTAAQHVFHRLRHAAVLATVPGRSFHGRKSIEKP